MQVSVKQLYDINVKMANEDFDPEIMEDVNDLIGIIEEADGCHSLDFFGITVDTTQDDYILNIPDDLDIQNAINIISAYLNIVEDNQQRIRLLTIPVFASAVKYDEHTEPYRGADDGTFDYAGTYMLIILEAIQQYYQM